MEDTFNNIDPRNSDDQTGSAAPAASWLGFPAWYNTERHGPVPIGETNSLQHAALIFGVSLRTVRRMIDEGEIAVTRIRRRLTIPGDAIRQYIEEHTVRPERRAPAPTSSRTPDSTKPVVRNRPRRS